MSAHPIHDALVSERMSRPSLWRRILGLGGGQR